MTEFKIAAEGAVFGESLGPKAMVKEKYHVVVDIDGVVATEGPIPVYSDKANWNYSACVPVAGAKEGLAELRKRYHVTLFSSRRQTDLAVTIQWLKDNGFYQGTHYDDVELGAKPRAVIYLDDRAVRFETWSPRNVIKMINHAETAIRQEKAHADAH